MSQVLERVFSDAPWTDRIGLELVKFDEDRYGIFPRGIGKNFPGGRQPRVSWHVGFVAAAKHFNKRLAALGIERPANRFAGGEK